MKNNIVFIALAASLSLTLVGCGGGGSSTTPVNVAPAPLPVPVPTQVVLAATIQPLVAPTYLASSPQLSAFSALATFRSALGLGPLNQNTKIDIAAQNHADYIALNNGGASPHEEIAGKAGFTGANLQDRLVNVGYAATDSAEVIGWTGRTANASEVIEGLGATVYHRVLMMDQRMTDVGIAPPVNGEVVRPAYIDFGVLTQAQNVAGDYVGVYPTNGQVAVGFTHAPEAPNPFPDMDGTAAAFCAKTSYPISLMTQQSTKLAVTSFTVTEDGHAVPLDVRLITGDTDKTGFVPTYVAFIVGTAPFKANTTYRVKFIGTATGPATGAATGVLNINKSWSFTTAASNYRC